QSVAFADDAVALTLALRRAGIRADCDNTGRSLKAQFKFADKQNAAYALVIGESERASGVYTVKRLCDGVTETCPGDGLAAYFGGKQ
ncbi:MAG: histidine--tRNA ligase, partial [Clostridiales bacterium]|nr:histidine--tRNA ligase [Clostridiales bacterium]